MDKQEQPILESQIDISDVEKIDKVYGCLLDDYEENEQIITIFDNKENYNAKHKLNTAWNFFYTRPSKNWEEGVVFLGSVETIEDFFIFYKKLSIKQMSNLYAVNLFRKHSKPLWEHETNKGCQRTKLSVVGKKEDVLFLKVALMCIGEVFGKTGLKINGIKVEKKEKGNRVEIWYAKDIKDTEIDQIIEEIKKVAGSIVGSVLTHFHTTGSARKNFSQKKDEKFYAKNSFKSSKYLKKD